MEKSKISQWALINKSWVGAFDVIFGANKIAIPFVVIALLELIGIAALFIAIQPPAVKYITPIVLRFWGEQFLHYPFNLLLLSGLFSHLQVVLAVVLGTLCSGLTISNVFQYTQTKQFSCKTSFKKALIKYVSLIIITILVFFLVKFSYSIEKKVLIKIMMKGQSFLGLRREDWSMLFMVFGLIAAGFIQSLFAFTHAAIMIDNKNFITAIFRNITFVIKNLFVVCILVIVPLVVYIPVTLLKGNLFELMKRTTPEIVFAVLGLGVFVSFFINVLVTISTTNAYILIKGQDDD
ncbi:MAG: hypothetical protein V1739_04265 [Candidatus Omnitrophota bacterium]